MSLRGLVFTLSMIAVCAVAAAAEMPDVLARYESAVQHNAGSLNCRAVDVDIDAALPREAKHGHLRAIRRLILGKPRYQVLYADGDPTVRRQVIARYLSAQLQSEDIPAASIALTRANYKFRYVSSFGAGTNLSCVYSIKPRHRRIGLVQGEVWIDAASGLPTHQSGRLVKNPSVFLRRVNVTQDTDYHNGLAVRRITRLEIETRLIGPAQINITEHPCRTVVTSVAATRIPSSGEHDDEACIAN